MATSGDGGGREDTGGAGQGDEDRASITDAGGTVARFEMSYSPPVARHRFGAPLSALIPGFVYLGAALSFALVVAIGYSSPYGSTLSSFTAGADRGRTFPISVLALFLALSAIGTVARGLLRGIVVDETGLEVRALLLLGIPRLRRYAWAQIHRIVVDDRRVMIELWHGGSELLPAVRDAAQLANTLASIASRRHITVTHLAPHR
jgi:hypothetical protein